MKGDIEVSERPAWPCDRYERRCQDCVCLVEVDGKAVCDEVEKDIHTIEDCPEELVLDED